MNASNSDNYTLDLATIFKAMLRKAWAIILCVAVFAAGGFSIAAFFIHPTYSADVRLYVNNSSFSISSKSFSISASELNAAQSLVRTYGEILVSRSTLERVAEKSGTNYSWKKLSESIKYAPSNNTEIMKVTVTCEDPYEASKIANTIAAVLPERITEIIDGASMEVVDYAVPDLRKVSPSITKYTAVGMLLGAVTAMAFIVITVLLDDTVHDEGFILDNYDYPILGKVPDLNGSGNGRAYYYSQSTDKSAGGRGE